MPSSAGRTTQRQRLTGLVTGRISAKIVGPYLVLMFVLALLATYVVLRLVNTSLEQRFTNELLDAGKAANDDVLTVEGEQLQLFRLMANTQGVAAAVQQRDVKALLQRLTPLEMNSPYRFVDVFGADGKQVLALRPANSPQYSGVVDPNAGSWQVTKQALSGQADQLGDKYSALVRTSFGLMLYSGGAVRNASGQPVGAILVGMPLTDLLHRLTTDVLANVTIYQANGARLGTTLPAGGAGVRLDPSVYQAVTAGRSQVVRQSLTIDGHGYLEVVGALVIRGAPAAAIGVAVPTNDIAQSGARTRDQLLILFGLVICGVLGLGLILARRITEPIQRLVRACVAVASGDLEQQVRVTTTDETGILATSFNAMVQGLKEREFIRDTFGRYVTKQVSEAILQGELKLGGERKEVTVLISDIRAFTTLSESLEPEQLVTWLNRYFGRMIDAIVRFEGTVDKFIGDAILVVYGAPVPVEDHATRAVRSALEMCEQLRQFNEEAQAKGLPIVRMGIGINSGYVIAGNIGSLDRMEYTVVGDTVNVAQRLEELNKETGFTVQISESTYERLPKERFIFGAPLPIAVRGRSASTVIYPVLGLRSSEAPAVSAADGITPSEPPAIAEADELAPLEALQLGRSRSHRR